MPGSDEPLHLSAFWSVRRTGAVVRLVADNKTASCAPCVGPGREEAGLVTVPFFAQATWMLPGTFEDLPPSIVAPGKLSSLPHF